VTLWSGTAWTEAAKEGENSWLKINLNTAERPVLETLFYEHYEDFPLVNRILEYRGTEKEGTGTSGGGEPDVDEPLSAHQYFENLEDLKKVDGIDDAVLDRNKTIAQAATFESQTFAIDLMAERDGVTRQVRYIVRRNEKGVRTLLREERDDPTFEEKPKDGEEDR